MPVCDELVCREVDARGVDDQLHQSFVVTRLSVFQVEERGDGKLDNLIGSTNDQVGGTGAVTVEFHV